MSDRVWRNLELKTRALSEQLTTLTGQVSQQRTDPASNRRALLSLLDDLSGWTWDVEIACQQLQARRPNQAQAEKALLFAFDRLCDQLDAWQEAWEA